MAQAPETVEIIVDLPGVGAYEDLDTVGTVYEVGINGQGYMLANNPAGNGPERARGSVPLLPDRLATSQTPFAESINRYTFAAQSQFEGGEGQDFLEREDADPKMFRDGERIDPFTSGKITVGPDSGAVARATAHSTPYMASAQSYLFVAAGAAELDYYTGSWSTLSGLTDTTGAIPAITDLTSDGENWYAATGRSIIRGFTANPAADWSAQDAVHVQWAAGRIVAAVKTGSSTTPNRFTTLNDSGAEEKTNGHYTFPEEHTIHLGGVAGGYYWFADTAGEKGGVWAWQLGVDDGGNFFVPYEAWALPHGAELIDVSTAGGSLWIQIGEGISGDRVLYRGIPNEAGQLTIVRVATEDGGHTAGDRSRAVEFDGKVLVLWPDHDTGAPGVAAVSLESGGFAKWTAGIGAAADSHFDMEILSDTIYVSDTDGDVRTVATTVATDGWFTTPIADGGSALDKVWDDVTLTFEPLGANEVISVEYSTDGGGSYTALGSVSTAGATRAVFELGQVAASLSMKVTLSKGTTSAPTLTAAIARFHPLGLVDGVLVLPVICADQVEGLNGQVLPGTGPGFGAQQARTLEGLAGQRVRVQDIDWVYTRTTETYEVLQAESTGTWIVEKSIPRLEQVVVLTLRKTITQ